MGIRFDHIVVALVVTVILVLGIYLIDVVFSASYSTKAHRYDSEFAVIKSEFDNKNYPRVIVLANEIIAHDEPGDNEIRAKVYIGLSKLLMNETEKSIIVLEYLINKYPGIEMVYAGLARNKSKDNLTFIYNNILSTYIPRMEKAVNRKMTLVDIYNSMDVVDWFKLVSVLVGAVVVYERIIRKGKSKVSNIK